MTTLNPDAPISDDPAREPVLLRDPLDDLMTQLAHDRHALKSCPCPFCNTTGKEAS